MKYLSRKGRRRGRYSVRDDRGVGGNVHIDIQKRDSHRHVKAPGDPIGGINRVLVNRQIDIGCRLNEIADEAWIASVFCRHS